MAISEQVKIKYLLDTLYQNNERIAVYEQLEKDMAINSWLMEAYTEASAGRPEFKDVFNRELSGIRLTLHRLKSQYLENKSEYEKKRLQRQNMAIKLFLEKRFDINLSNVITKFMSKQHVEEEPQDKEMISVEKEVFTLIKETAREGKSLYTLLSEEELEADNGNHIPKYKAPIQEHIVETKQHKTTQNNADAEEKETSDYNEKEQVVPVTLAQPPVSIEKEVNSKEFQQQQQNSSKKQQHKKNKRKRN